MAITSSPRRLARAPESKGHLSAPLNSYPLVRPGRSRDYRVALNLSSREIVRVAPHPSFARFDRTDERVFGLVEVLRGMLVFGGVAASDMTAFQAQTQVHPGIAGFHAIFADVFRGMKDADLIEMGTVWFPGHEFLLSQTARRTRDSSVGNRGVRIRGSRNPQSRTPSISHLLILWLAW